MLQIEVDLLRSSVIAAADGHTERGRSSTSMALPQPGDQPRIAGGVNEGAITRIVIAIPDAVTGRFSKQLGRGGSALAELKAALTHRNELDNEDDRRLVG